MPPQPPADARADGAKGQQRLQALAGDYRFSPIAALRVTEEGGRLYGQATGKRAVFAIRPGERVELLPSGQGFGVPGRYPMVLRFGPKGALTINPGPWAQFARRSAR